MGIVERKEREKQEMRELILHAATQLFMEVGYDKASIRNIADRIEYSPATIYLYFKDKDEIFHAIHEQGFAILFQKMQEANTIVNPFDRLCKVGDIYIQFAYDYPEYYDLMFIMRAPMVAIEENNEWGCGFQAYEMLKLLVRECIDGGYMREMDVEVACLSVWSFMHGMTSLAIRDRYKMYSPDQVKPLMDAAKNEVLRMFQRS